MCTVCGCGDVVTLDGRKVSHDEAHRFGLAHHHPAPSGGLHHYGLGAAGVSVPGMSQARLIEVETSILAKNDALAAGNRQVLAGLGAFAVNLVSSPGSGKTTLLCKTIEALGAAPLAVIEGDQQTDHDAARIRATGARAVQVNTGKGCHLDAQMVGGAMAALALEPASFLFIENVGNLVCPAHYDLGENARVVLLSVTEGEDKPLKYPPMFHSADAALITKIDLADAAGFDRAAAYEALQSVRPGIETFELSARTGQGMEAWLDYLLRVRATSPLAAFASSTPVEDGTGA